MVLKGQDKGLHVYMPQATYKLTYTGLYIIMYPYIRRTPDEGLVNIKSSKRQIDTISQIQSESWVKREYKYVSFRAPITRPSGFSLHSVLLSIYLANAVFGFLIIVYNFKFRRKRLAVSVSILIASGDGHFVWSQVSSHCHGHILILLSNDNFRNETLALNRSNLITSVVNRDCVTPI